MRASQPKYQDMLSVKEERVHELGRAVVLAKLLSARLGTSRTDCMPSPPYAGRGLAGGTSGDPDGRLRGRAIGHRRALARWAWHPQGNGRNRPPGDADVALQLPCYVHRRHPWQ